MKAIVSVSSACAVATALMIGSSVQQLRAQAGAPADTQQDSKKTAHPSATEARDFINHMAIAGLAEVELGKMAADKATSPDVKAFGQMMMTDHTQAGKALEQVAAQLNIQPPKQIDQKHRELSDRLSKLEGAAFDREYMAAMVKGHEEVASQLQARVGHHAAAPSHSATTPAGSAGQQGGVPPPNSPASGHRAGVGASAGEQALTQWATMTLPTVQKHLERARALQQPAK